MAKKKDTKSRMRKVRAEKAQKSATSASAAADPVAELMKLAPLLLVCTLFTSVAQLLWKLGANKLKLDFISLITNIPLIAGCILYFVGAALLIFALKKGNLSAVYPMLSSSYIWVALMSMFFLGEKILLLQWLGILAIMIGITFVGAGAK